MFASDLDPASRAQLARGARLVELLKQPQSAPYPVEEQVVAIWLGTTGQLDDVAVEDVRRFEAEFLDFMRRERPGVLATIRETTKLEDDTVGSLEQAVAAYKSQFKGADGAPQLGSAPESTDELSENEIDQAQIVKQKH